MICIKLHKYVMKSEATLPFRFPILNEHYYKHDGGANFSGVSDITADECRLQKVWCQRS